MKLALPENIDDLANSRFADVDVSDGESLGTEVDKSSGEPPSEYFSSSTVFDKDNKKNSVDTQETGEDLAQGVSFCERIFALRLPSLTLMVVS